MADEKDPKKKPAEKAKPEPKADEKPKRTRAASTRKAAASKEDKPARAKPKAKAPAKAKAKADDKQADEKKAAEKKADEKPKPRRTTTRAKKADSPKAEAKQPEAAAEKKPARRTASTSRSGRRPAVAPIVTARARYVRSSARKARLVIDHVRGKPIGEARALLRHSPRGVARDLERLLESAIANAENNHDLVGEDLYVKEIYADEGPTLKRFQPRAQGRAFRIRKRTSHLTVALTPKE
jgi:ribosomal protein L22